MKRNIHFILFVLIILCSCDNRRNVYEGLSGNLSLDFLLPGGAQSKNFDATVKVSQKSGRPYKDFAVKFQDLNGSITSISYEVSGGRLVLLPSLDTLSGRSGNIVEQISDRAGYFEFRFIPDRLNDNNCLIGFKATNAFNKIQTISGRVRTFINKTPIADLVVSPVGQASPFEYELDATGSADPDANEGGGLVISEFYVNDQLIASWDLINNPNKIRWNFMNPGVYDLYVVVTDTDGATAKSNVVRVEVTR